MRKRSSSTAKFMAGFIAHPGATGSIIPSSRFLAARMLSRIDWRRARVIVELGPGTGCVTREILGRMHRTAKLFAVEINPHFAAQLTTCIADPRLTVAIGSALALDRTLENAGLRDADHIVCSLPFANMAAPVRFGIVERAKDCLASGGSFVLFQYRRLMLPVLQEVFPSVRSEFEWRNFPPAHVFYCSETSAVESRSIRTEACDIANAEQEYACAHD